jgi:hypothetical protein
MGKSYRYDRRDNGAPLSGTRARRNDTPKYRRYKHTDHIDASCTQVELDDLPCENDSELWSSTG